MHDSYQRANRLQGESGRYLRSQSNKHICTVGGEQDWASLLDDEADATVRHVRRLTGVEPDDDSFQSGSLSCSIRSSANRARHGTSKTRHRMLPMVDREGSWLSVRKPVLWRVTITVSRTGITYGARKQTGQRSSGQVSC